MRGMFSLVGLLVTVGIVMWLYSTYSIPAAREGRKAQDEARQISGRGADGIPAEKSATLEAQESSGRLQSIAVRDVVDGGALQQYYGLQKGDEIVEIVGVWAIKDTPNNDGELAKAEIAEAYGRKQPLVVMRSGQRVTLPATGAPTPAGEPKSAIEKQLDTIRIPTH